MDLKLKAIYFAVLMMTASLAGCVSQDDYDTAIEEHEDEKAEDAAQKNIARQIQAGKQAILAAPEADRPGIARQLREQILVTRQKARQAQKDSEINALQKEQIMKELEEKKLKEEQEKIKNTPINPYSNLI